MDVGLLGIALSVVAFAAAVRPFARHAPLALVDVGFLGLARLAFAGSLLFAVLAGGYAVGNALGGAPGLLYDGARHAFTLGFVTLFIFAMAGQIVPRFTGVELRRRRALIYGVSLIVAGLVLREAQVGAALFRLPWLLKVSGVSGIVAAAGVGLAAVSILATLRAGARAHAVAGGGT
jgi:hypothetical protein